MKAFFIGLAALIHLQVSAQERNGSLSTNRPGKGMFFQKEAITTSFKDVDTSRCFADGFGDSATYLPLQYMPKTDSGAFILPPGFYEMNCESYCIRAGTYGPSAGDGYGWAELSGPQQNLMITALRKSRSKKHIKQQDLQLLFWAIIAKAKFNTLNERIKVTALSLFNAKEILQMNKMGIGLIPQPLIDRAMLQLPPTIAAIIKAENSMRSMFSNTNAVYRDFERMAVLNGSARVDRPDIKRGRWFKHPCGYFVRYFPENYSKTKVQVYVPEEAADKGRPCVGKGTMDGLEVIGVIFDAIGSVAVPANTGSQRLLQSNVVFN